MLNPVKLPVAIYLCLICLLLTCFVADRPNVQDQSLVERLQHTYVEALHSYICINRPNVSDQNITSDDASGFCVYAGRVPAVLSVTGLLLLVLSCLSLLGSLIAAVNAGFVSCHNLLSCIMFHSLASMESLEFCDMMYYLCSFTLHPPGECWV